MSIETENWKECAIILYNNKKFIFNLEKPFDILIIINDLKIIINYLIFSKL